ncbi:hypothetical protein L484_020394 [Morus notabilis]|uniref:Uncharacterized protein n=1 Tax=Morus notabilis TaxID=981085 RepID=W9RQR5_9ROSA|nr:hypothetical protein L484_020394 [Morus notabilis]
MRSNYEIANQNRLRAVGSSQGPNAARTTNPAARRRAVKQTCQLSIRELSTNISSPAIIFGIKLRNHVQKSKEKKNAIVIIFFSHSETTEDSTVNVS